MTFFQIYLLAGLVILGCMTVLWIISLILKNSSIVDIFWGLGFVITNWVYFALSPEGFLGRKWLIGVLVTVWGLRLSLYILWRNWGKGEDFRYQKLRRDAGGSWWWQSFFKVFLFQGVLMWLISTPLLFPHFLATPARLTFIDFLGVVLWGIGFFFEALGDWQLSRFKGQPSNKGKLLTTGVWRYTRHPNYFGDAAQWWGYYLIAAATGLGVYSIFSPILMTFLLLRVTGVALLEKSLKEVKPGYEAYVQNTNAFIPWFPRKGSSDSGVE
jgi:steroid 5-alpha reductase family enzyme